MPKLTSQCIIDCVRAPNTLSSLSLQQWNDLVVVLKKEKMLARVYLLLCQCELVHIIPVAARRHFQNAEKISIKQGFIARREAENLTATLADKARYLVYLKGAAYSLAESPAALGRVYADIDIVVPKDNLQEIEKYLTVFGWYSEELDDYDAHYYRQWAHEIPPMRHSSRGTVLDIHHNLVPPVSGKHIDIVTFIARNSETVNGVCVLCEPAKFFHSAIHLFFNEDMTSAFRDMTDLYLMTREPEDGFFEQLLSIIDEFGFEKECMLALYLLEQRYDISLPLCAVTRLNVFEKRARKWELTLMSRLTEPKHKYLVEGESLFLQFVGEMRGHALKMPLPILAYHVSMKCWRAIIKSLFGKHVFAKEEIR